MNLADWLLKYATDANLMKECERRDLCEPIETIAPALVYAEITSGELHDLLPQEFINPWNNSKYTIRRTWWDGKFYLTSDAEVLRFLKWDKTNKRDYIADTYDCNSFAVSWWANFREWFNGGCGGMITEVKPGHALNFYVNNNRVVKIVEPQSDAVYALEKFPYIDHFLI